MSERPRRGLVLGGGGVLGAAWTVGALRALELEYGLDAREFDEYVGTSAGSVLVALLAAGVGVDDLLRHQRDEPLVSGPLEGFFFDYGEATGGAKPGKPKHGIGSKALLSQGVRYLRALPPMVVVSALLPEGRGRLDGIGALVAHCVPNGWVERDGVAVVAMDYESGQRVAFGRDGTPPADLWRAVMASCAIPGWYEPIRIGEHRYIDGGAWSSTSVDLMVGRGLDEVYVLAPSVSFDVDSPHRFATRMERRWRNHVTARCLREVAEVHADGAQLTVLGPGRRDLEVMGGNLMDAARRSAVIETSVITSAQALHDPAPLPAAAPYEEES
ncbi:MAG TPA: patatin-like phospholipase family protein [Segeticoccus sp.]|uniref:patatin-like phospholipase family protein n=1 Tax=Segeticoccus sp. TaxID=2706531 RepID=UPI002D7FF89A|nr:patatin-like phospholipase family protein [Segeticoccus sp.]HET8600969.1 patatin-like phospholipase family protein [Segeticoccus sp.]